LSLLGKADLTSAQEGLARLMRENPVPIDFTEITNSNMDLEDDYGFESGDED